jgi:hypothetical protein
VEHPSHITPSNKKTKHYTPTFNPHTTQMATTTPPPASAHPSPTTLYNKRVTIVELEAQKLLPHLYTDEALHAWAHKVTRFSHPPAQEEADEENEGELKMVVDAEQDFVKSRYWHDFGVGRALVGAGCVLDDEEEDVKEAVLGFEVRRKMHDGGVGLALMGWWYGIEYEDEEEDDDIPLAELLFADKEEGSYMVGGECDSGYDSNGEEGEDYRVPLVLDDGNGT